MASKNDPKVKGNLSPLPPKLIKKFRREKKKMLACEEQIKKIISKRPKSMFLGDITFKTAIPKIPPDLKMLTIPTKDISLTKNIPFTLPDLHFNDILPLHLLRKSKSEYVGEHKLDEKDEIFFLSPSEKNKIKINLDEKNKKVPDIIPETKFIPAKPQSKETIKDDIEKEFSDVVKTVNKFKLINAKKKKRIIECIPVMISEMDDLDNEYKHVLFDNDPVDIIKKSSFIKQKNNSSQQDDKKTAENLLIHDSVLVPSGDINYNMYVANKSEGDLHRKDFIAKYTRRNAQNIKPKINKTLLLVSKTRKHATFIKVNKELKLKKTPFPISDEDRRRYKEIAASVDVEYLEKN